MPLLAAARLDPEFLLVASVIGLAFGSPLLATSWILLTLWRHPLGRFAMVAASFFVLAVSTPFAVACLWTPSMAWSPTATTIELGVVLGAAGLPPSLYLTWAFWRLTRSGLLAASPLAATAIAALVAHAVASSWSPITLIAAGFAWHATVVAGLCAGRARVTELIPDRPGARQCRRCGYDLRGLPSSVCPECRPRGANRSA